MGTMEMITTQATSEIVVTSDILQFVLKCHGICAQGVSAKFWKEPSGAMGPT